MKKKIIMYFVMLVLAFAGVTASATSTPTDTQGAYETDKGIKFSINDPAEQDYTGIAPDDPLSGYDVYTQQNADVGVKVTYNPVLDESTYLYGYVMEYSSSNGYWAFDLGNNKITKNDDFDFYVVNIDTKQEYLVDDMEDKTPSSFSFYANNIPYGSYQLKIVVKGNKTTTMNGIDIIEELSGENAAFGDEPTTLTSPCSKASSGTVYNYFYYTFDKDASDKPIATDQVSKLEEFEKNTGITTYNLPDDEDYYYIGHVLSGILGFGSNSSKLNHDKTLYKHTKNCSYFLYTKQNANYPDVYVHGIFEQELLQNYFYSENPKGEKSCYESKYQYDYETYLKNGHTSEIEYYTLSLKYTYKVYTPKNFEELSFKGYMDRTANQISEYIDAAYENGVRSCDELIASLNQQITTLNNTVASKNQEISFLQNQLDEKNNQITSILSLLDRKDKELSEIQKELDSYKNQVDVLTSQIKEKESQLTDLLKDTNAKTEEISSLRNSITTLNALNDTAKAQLQEAEENKTKLETSITSLNLQITNLKTDAETKQNNINNLNKEVQDLKKEISEKEAEVATLERVIGFKDDKISGLEKEKEDNKFFSSNGYWKKLFNFADAEHWNICNWLTWIGLGIILIAAFIVFVKKKK